MYYKIQRLVSTVCTGLYKVEPTYRLLLYFYS